MWKQLIQKMREFNLEMHLDFTDYEKVFDRYTDVSSKEHANIVHIIERFYCTTKIVLDTGK